MILVLFAIAFVIISLILLHIIHDWEDRLAVPSVYKLYYIKGSARGSMGRFISNSMLEEKRTRINRKNSKF